MERKTLRRVFVAAVVILICALWIATFPALRCFVPDADTAIAQRGQIGDAFGAINALFSGLGLAGVVFAILQQQDAGSQQARALDLQLKALELQQQDLASQLEEMQATRDEMKRHADAAEKQGQALDAQRKALLLNAAVTAVVSERAHLSERQVRAENTGSVNARRQAEHLRGDVDALSEVLSALRTRAIRDAGL